MSPVCNLCAAPTIEKIYTLDASAINSLRETQGAETHVWLCSDCGHTFTEPLKNIEAFYADDYNILTGSEDEDQLLKIVDGKKIFRSDFQAETLAKAVNFQPGMRVLDYGCAKAATLKKLLQRCAVDAHVFDVSDNYQPFWQEHFAPDHQAVHTLPERWNATMDVVYSFFCLEHVEDAIAALTAQYRLLKTGGICYFVVPNFHTNIADLLVIDHINHFAETSLRYALARAGFTDVTIDGETQAGWWMVTAKRGQSAATAALPAESAVKPIADKSREIASYWSTVDKNLSTLAPTQPTAIYGAGFYGTYVALHLNPAVKIECFLDQNSFLQGTTHMDRPVLAPSDIPPHVKRVLVALNPAHARKTIAAMDVWQGRDIQFEFVF